MNPEQIIQGIQALVKADGQSELEQVAQDYPVLLTEEALIIIQQNIVNFRAEGQDDIATLVEERYQALLELNQNAQSPTPSSEQALTVLEADTVLTESPDEEKSLLQRWRERGKTSALFIKNKITGAAKATYEYLQTDEGKKMMMVVGTAIAAAVTYQLYKTISQENDKKTADLTDKKREVKVTVGKDMQDYLSRILDMTGIDIDIEEAITTGNYTITSIPSLKENDQKRSQDFKNNELFSRVENLTQQANQAKQHYIHTNDPDYINECINSWQEILSHSDFSSLPFDFKLKIMQDAGDSFQLHGLDQKRPASLDIANHLFREVLANLPENSSERLDILANLTEILSELYELRNNLPPFSNETGGQAYLEQAITFTNELVELLPENSLQPYYLSKLSSLYADLYENHTRELQDLNMAITSAEDAIKFSTPDVLAKIPYFHATLLVNLGRSLQDRYSHLGKEIDDIEKAGSLLLQAINIIRRNSNVIPQNLSKWSEIINALSTRLYVQSNLTGVESYFDQAFVVIKQVIDYIPQDSQPSFNLGMNLVVLLNERLEYTNSSLQDLMWCLEFVKGIDFNRISPQAPMILNNLSLLLGNLYKKTDGEAIYLERAIASVELALEDIPNDSPHKGILLGTLGNHLLTRYKDKNLRTESDLEQAKENYKQAQKLLHRRTEKSRILISLGNVFRISYFETNNELDSKQAMEYYKQACKNAIILTDLLLSSRSWGFFALQNQFWLEVIEASSYTLDTIERTFQTQLQRHQKENWLRRSRGFHTDGAYAHAKVEDYRQTVTILEYGRTFLLSEALERNRADLERLRDKGHADKYEIYQNILNEISVLENLQESSNLDHIRQVQTKLDETIEQIRQIKGYENFLRLQPDFEMDILQALPNSQTVLVYIAVTSVGGLALIVQTDGTVTPVWCDTLTGAAIEEQYYGQKGYQHAYQQRSKNSKAWEQAIDNTTRWLWDVLMGPLIAELKNIPALNQVILIPQGWLGLLPLHAAWTEDPSKPTERRYALDEYNFTYTPNARALKKGHNRNITFSNSILVIENPHSDLGTFAKIQTETILPHFSDNHHLIGPTSDQVKATLGGYSVTHFYTHGQAVPQKPLESSLELTPGHKITLREIMDLRLQGAHLAILSACETNIPGQDLPDEVINLPTGLVQAGFSAVIGSLWAVEQDNTTMLMARFYDIWRNEKDYPPQEALRQAQLWLRDTTNSEKLAYFERLLSKDLFRFIRRRLTNNELQYSHPFEWAAFTYTGI